MIDYTEKGAGLHARIAAAGHWLQSIDGVWHSSDDAAVQALIDGYTVADSQSDVCARINALGRQLRDSAVAGVSPAEMASWPIKRAEAIAYTATGNAADAPMLTAEAAARGVTLADIVARVQGNAAALSMLEAMIGGTEGKHRDAVKALTTFEAVLAYDYSGGWPA